MFFFIANARFLLTDWTKWSIACWLELNWFYLIMFLTLISDSYSTQFITYHSIKVIIKMSHEFLSYLIINKLWYDVRNDKGVWINFDLKESFIINHIMCINYGTDRLNQHEMKFTAYLMSVSWFQNETKARTARTFASQCILL